MTWSRKPEFIVELRWLSAAEGGRASGPPALSEAPDSEYGGVWVENSDRAWSFFLHPADPSELPDRYEAMRPFAEDGAPSMTVGQEFTLTEGAKRVAEGRIVRVLPYAPAVSGAGH